MIMPKTKKEPENAEERLPILPLRNSVLFPHAIVPIDVGRAKSVKLIEELSKQESQVLGVLSQRDPETSDPAWNEMYPVGTVARVLKVIKLDRGGYRVVIHGIVRFSTVRTVTTDPYHQAVIQRLQDSQSRDIEIDALLGSIFDTLEQVVALLPNFPRDIVERLHSSKDPSLICDLVAANIPISVEERQNILEMLDIKPRLRLTLQFLMRQLEVLKVKKEISSMVQEEMGKSQREYFLRQQMKAIRDELGESEEDEDDLEELRQKITDAGLPEEVDKVARKQLSRLKQMQPSSAEYTVVRIYLDWLLELPWTHATQDHLNVAEARKILEEDHYNLKKVQKRILEYLAVRKLKEDKKGPILCFVGPPGVGKTSLGKSIARAMGRNFMRISLGGVRDEAEIRGHRRTYVGALPGRIIQCMKKAGSINPVFMLDEVDKLGTDFRGDPSSALLEVLDPEQNDSFSDHYVEVPYDLSRVLFIGTANVQDTIPPPLLDRMEVIEIPGYTREEKKKIARQFLIPKQLEEHGLHDYRFEWTEGALDLVVDSYTRESGVRNLEREIASICRHIAVLVAEDGKIPETVDEALVEKVLGPVKYYSEVAEMKGEPGVATGLAWTPTGGDILFIEATKMLGKAKLNLTGQLGDVMKESAQAALSYVHANAKELGFDDEVFEKNEFHIHVPAGAIPKDGPSAGITMYVAIASLLMGRSVRPDVAMTGEITLRGMVLQVGGIKEKVLAAHRAGIKRIVMPKRNEKDLQEIPKEIREEMSFSFIKHMSDVLEFVLVDEGEERIPGTTPSKDSLPPRPQPAI
ncbi:MAG: endopeptidase La [Deltaproteobacteria bacterium]|nr:endopeptidase La [Deltaproteobacteria bacterium]